MAKYEKKRMAGKKIRRQYFNTVLHAVFLVALSVPFYGGILSAAQGRFAFGEWLSVLWMTLGITSLFCVPLIPLALANRYFFGKTVCVLSEKGITYGDDFVAWECIREVQYEIQLCSRHRYLIGCRAILYTESGEIVLFHAPLYLLSQVRNYRPEMSAKISRFSKWKISLASVCVVIVTPLLLLLA